MEGHRCEACLARHLLQDWSDALHVRRETGHQVSDFRDAEAIVEAVQRPTMKFVATKTTDQLDLQAAAPGA